MPSTNNNREQANESHNIDLKKKEAQEELFNEDLNEYYNNIADDFAAVFLATGQVLNLNESYVSELESLLKKNYRRISNNFKYELRNEIENIILESYPDLEKEEVKWSTIEKTIAMGLGAWILTRAKELAPKIANTAQERAKKELSDFLVESAKTGALPSREVIAKEVGDNFKEWGKNHSPVVSVTETQITAELSKNLEASSLQKNVLDTNAEVNFITKRWVTRGNEKVRSSHAAADYQLKKENEPFVLGSGAQLMYPGDISLGAPLKDIINCYCSAIYVLNGEVIKIIKNSIFRRKSN